jgi:hypothetical protein
MTRPAATSAPDLLAAAAAAPDLLAHGASGDPPGCTPMGAAEICPQPHPWESAATYPAAAPL